MAEKRFDKRERIINDIERFVNADIAKAEDDREMTLLEEVVRIYDKTVEAIHASSTLGPRFIGGLYDLQNLHFDGCDDDCKCYSFRFDIDNGYFLDASCIWRWRPFHNFIDETERILPIADKIVPWMKDSMQIEGDVLNPYSQCVRNLFISRSIYSDIVDGVRIFFKSKKDFHREMQEQVKHEEFTVWEYEPGLFSVKYDHVRLLLRRYPQEDDFEWIRQRIPDLEELSEPVSRNAQNFNFHIWKGNPDNR